jgi:hypothetical protein
MNHLKIADSGINKYLAREIKTAPAWMLPREFTQNGIDNAIPGKGVTVTWTSMEVDGATKLVVYDNAAGMSLDDLHTLTTEMGVSFGTKDGTHNHGVGARLIGLHSNPHGLVYYTRQNNGPVYTATLALDENGAPICSVAPTKASVVPEQIRDLSSGTMVVFMGNSPDHNTALEPWKGAKGQRSTFAKMLVQRYVSLPEGAKVKLEKEVCTDGREGKNQHTFEGTARLYRRASKHEVVRLDNMRITYALFPKSTTSQSRINLGGVSLLSFGAVAMDGEIYSMTEDRRWPAEAIRFGIDDIAERTIIVVEIDRSLGVSPKTDRTALIWDKPQPDRSGYRPNRTDVHVRNFETEIVRFMPKWLVDEASKARKSKEDDTDKEYLRRYQEMAKEMQTWTKGFIKSPNGEEGFGKVIDNVFQVGKHNNGKGKKRGKKTDVGNGKGSERLISPELDVKMHKDASGDWFRYARGENGSTSSLSVNQETPYMVSLKARIEKEIGSDKFEPWWDSWAPRIARLTFGKYHINLMVLDASGFKDAAFDLSDASGVLSANSHFYEFSQEMMKQVKKEIKKPDLYLVSNE